MVLLSRNLGKKRAQGFDDIGMWIIAEIIGFTFIFNVLVALTIRSLKKNKVLHSHHANRPLIFSWYFNTSDWSYFKSPQKTNNDDKRNKMIKRIIGPAQSIQLTLAIIFCNFYKLGSKEPVVISVGVITTAALTCCWAIYHSVSPITE